MGVPVSCGETAEVRQGSAPAAAMQKLNRRGNPNSGFRLPPKVRERGTTKARAPPGLAPAALGAGDGGGCGEPSRPDAGTRFQHALVLALLPALAPTGKPVSGTTGEQREIPAQRKVIKLILRKNRPH